MIADIVTSLWKASHAFRNAANPNDQHKARIALIKVALSDAPRPAALARSILAKDGLRVVRRVVPSRLRTTS